MHGLVTGRDIMFSNAGSRRQNKVSLQVWLLALSTLVLFNFSASISLEDFYPFDIGADNKTEVTDDGGSEKILLDEGFPFFNYSYNSLYVNNNGIISFVDRLKSYRPANFNDSTNFSERIPLIAPFWADVDIEKVKGLNETVVFRITNDTDILTQASKDIQKHFTGQAGFQAKLVIIVTWYKVGFYGAFLEGKNKRNTFQAVLVTGGAHSVTSETESFAIFNYHNIVWTTGANSAGDTSTGLNGSPAVAGFSAGDLQQHYLLEFSGTPGIINITERSNIGIPGRYIFRLDGKIDDHSCFSSEKIEISPSSISMLGHEVIKVTGACLTPGAIVQGRIRDLNLTFSCHVSQVASAVCVPGSLFRTGELIFELNPYGTGWDFSTTLTSVNVLDVPAKLTRRDLEKWYLGNLVEVTWDDQISPNHKDKFLDILAYSVSSGGKPEFLVLKRLNISQGTPAFRSFKLLNESELDPNGSWNTLVTRLCWYETTNLTILPVCLWSDVFPVRWSSSAQSQQWCQTWLNREKQLPQITVRAPYCPCVVSIAENDFGNFQRDPNCDSYKTNVNTNCVYNPRAHKCFRRNSKSANDNGETCCYNNKGQLMDIREYPGSGTHQRYHYRAQGETGTPGDIVPFFSYFQSDLMPHVQCCLFSEELCKHFVVYRNATTCQHYSPPSPALAAGDPHLVTLDGKNYTFNGVGEFYLVTDVNNSIVIQVRAKQAENKGQLQNATVFTDIAVAVHEHSDVVEIGKQEAQILVNKHPYTITNSTTSHFRNISLQHNDDGSYLIVLEPVSVSVTVEVTPDLLNIIVLIGEESLKGKLRGLLGNYNGDPTDDFLSRNYSQVSSSASMRDIHYDFGMTWEVPAAESIFASPLGTSDDATQFQPVFIDEHSAENVKNGTYDICGSNIQCRFDYMITENEAVARSTAQFAEKFQTLKEQLEQKVVRCPYLSAPENGNVTKTGDSEGDVATFECNQDYELIQGNPVHVCLSNSTWSGTDVVCAKKTNTGGEAASNTLIVVVAVTVSSVLGVVIVIIIVTYCVKRPQKNDSHEIEIELTPISHIPVFEDPNFMRKLYETVGEGPFRIPRPKYVDPSLFKEFF